MKNEKSELRLWVLLVAIAAVLAGIGVVVAALTGGASVFEKFAEINPLLLIAAAVLIVGGGVGLVLYSRSHAAPAEALPAEHAKWSVKELITGALCIGLAFVLSYIRIFHLPQGGSVTAGSMLPIFIFAYIYGTPRGAIVAVVFGILQLIQDAYVVHWAQLFLDYIFAFGALSLAGLFKKSLLAGVIVGGLARTLFSILSGAIFFAEYAPVGQAPIIYSTIYQCSYMLPEIAICSVIVAIPAIRKVVSQMRSAAHTARTGAPVSSAS